MPIARTFGCPHCGHLLEVILTMEQVDDPPPRCPRCAAQTAQEFKPVAIGGSVAGKAAKLAETIAEEDYGVADMNVEGYQGVRNKVRYKDQTSSITSTWGTAPEVLNAAISAGRDTRLKYGSGLDIVKSQPDLIEISKRRSMKVW